MHRAGEGLNVPQGSHIVERASSNTRPSVCESVSGFSFPSRTYDALGRGRTQAQSQTELVTNGALVVVVVSVVVPEA